ncbi:hypothetical protein G6F50_014345 [Rhizopus delemar]|uniref:TonB-dependent receptor-like beta-barrel domain-containing protein n=1 Tax=Rhizopus delemar TaxID=936053 RepID=A0A9P6Y6Z5_9FUNG|nr:hypothetical protein G6F50_014345 [Rhizopus delemar]
MGVRTKGYELEMSGQLAEGWQVQGGFSHKIARQAGPKVTPLEPENQFSLHSSYRLRGAWQGLTMGGGARWQDSTFGEITNPATQAKVVHRTQPYWLLDAMARYEFNDRLSATLNVNNLLDKRYYTIFSCNVPAMPSSIAGVAVTAAGRTPALRRRCRFPGSAALRR